MNKQEYETIHGILTRSMDDLAERSIEARQLWAYLSEKYDSGDEEYLLALAHCRWQRRKYKLLEMEALLKHLERIGS